MDGVPVPNVTVADLDPAALRRFRERAAQSQRLTVAIMQENDEHLIERLLLSDGDHLKRAAVLLFHPDPERFVTGAYIKIGYFRSDSELLYHDEIHDSLFSQVERAIDLLLTKYLKAAISYEGVQRVETFPIPPEALREALMNAVTHKDYNSGVPIQISVYDDHIIFWNNGQLQDGWTVATLETKRASQPYNPEIANTFFRAGMIESWGLGIEKMRSACLEKGVPAPTLRYEETGLWVEFTIAAKTPVKTPDRILQILSATPTITLAAVAEEIGKSVSAVERASAKLVKAGRLRYVGPAKGGYWEVLD